MTNPLVWVGVAICVVVGLWGADRLALWAEARGWIFYRKTRRQTGANLGDAFLEIQSMLEPDRRHLLEVRRQEKAERTEAGDPPDNAPPGNR